MKLIQMLVGQMAVYAYIFGCEKTGEALVVDPAGGEADIVKRAQSEGFSIKLILNTHGHGDHTCGNHAIKELTGAPIALHKSDRDLALSPGSVQFTQSLGHQPTPEPDRLFEDGEVLGVGEEVSLKVVHTPGHTQGSVCFYTEGHLVTGDTLFVGGVGRTDLPGGSWPQLLESVQSRIFTLPDETRIWPGHHYGPSPSSTVKNERDTNPYLR
jgi:hydroxyacylglutathione hydrolase